MQSMKNPKIQTIITHYQHVFNGTPWYGDAMMDKLGKLSSSLAQQKPSEKLHSIADIIWHIIAWREYVIEKMDGNADFDIELNTTADWQDAGLDWTALLEKLQQNQELLIAKLSKKSDEWLEEIVSGREHSFEVLLQGIIRHDVYHLGQIGLIQKLLADKKAV